MTKINLKWFMFISIIIIAFPISYAGWGDGGWGDGGWGDESTITTTTTESGGGGGGGGGGGVTFGLDQLECNQRAKQQNRCLTYSSDSKSCEIGCQNGYSCNNNFVCEGFFLQPDYIPLLNLLVPNLQQEQCSKQGYTFFQDSCYNCAGKLANLKGTIVCLQCKEGYQLNDQDVCVQTFQQKTQIELNPIDKLMKKISPNNPFLGFLVMVGIGGILIYVYINRTIIKTKFGN